MGAPPISVCPLFPVGQKLTCGQGLEGPWERPPPLDEPERDGNSEDQVEDRATLSGELGSVELGGSRKPPVASQALSLLCVSEPGKEPQHPIPEPGT